MKILVLSAAIALVAVPCLHAETLVGVTPNSIKIGGTFPFSGPASALGNTGKGVMAYVDMINDHGGINGRKVEYIALDDAYSPPKAVEQGRRLVEQDEVAFVFSSLGTASNAATIKYYNSKKVPDAFIVSGTARFAVARDYPYTTTGLASYVTEAQIYAKYIRSTKPDAKIGILYQNDDFGKDYVAGFRAVYPDSGSSKIVLMPYDSSDPTIDSQIVSLKAAGVDVVMIAATPKFTAQALRRTAELGWKPIQIISIISSSISGTLRPAGLENAAGVVTSALYKDPGDTRWSSDAGVQDYRAFMNKYLPRSDANDITYITGYAQGGILEQLLKQCGSDLSRENIVKQMHDIKDLVLPMILPGIKVNTSETRNAAFTQLQLQRWNGEKWELFGDILDGDVK
jgi:branched-chain amino acid transport system substrate-binding protein